jgi:hypothetical protein
VFGKDEKRKFDVVLLPLEREHAITDIFLPDIQHIIELGSSRFRYRILKPVLKDIVKNLP